MKKRVLLTTAYIVLGLCLLTGCNYKPPYQRGYDEGYEAGLKASGGSGSSVADASDTGNDGSNVSDTSGSDASAGDTDDSGNKKEKPGISGLKKKEKNNSDSDEEAAAETDEASDTAADGEASGGSAADETAGDTASEAGDTAPGAEVLGAESEPAGNGGNVTIPNGRIIAAEAVNEALYSNPEVIDGLRQIYPDTAIFGEFVGDSETNIIHKVDGPHFSSLTYNTIVVFDGSKSLQDILNEGFFTKCDCAN